MKLAWTFISLLTLVTASSASESAIKVIANPSVKVTQISLDELKSVFLVTRTTLADGSSVEPVLLRSGTAHESFVKEYTGKTKAGLENYYRSLVFTGRGAMPRMFKSDEELVAYVKRTSGAVGYVTTAASTEGVKILDVRK